MSDTVKTVVISIIGLAVLFMAALGAQQYTQISPSGAYWKPFAQPADPSYTNSTNPVLKGDFSITIVPDNLYTSPGNIASYMITATRLNNFTGSIALTTAGLNNNQFIDSAYFDNEILIVGHDSTILNITIANPAPDLTINFSVSGTGTPGIRTDNAILNIVNLPDFTIDIFPDEQTVSPGESVKYTIQATRMYGFSGPIELTCDNLLVNPRIESFWFDNPILEGNILTTTLRIQTRLEATPGIIGFNVYGSGTPGYRVDSATLQVV